jgi:hypothetical protein
MQFSKTFRRLRWVGLCLSLLLALPAARAMAAPRVAVLGFEFYDRSGIPESAAEVARLDRASEQLRVAARESGGMTVIAPGRQAQQAANKGKGYLYECAQCAAEFGRSLGADFIAVGQFYKPTALFSYLFLRVIDTRNGALAAEYKVEAKGAPDKTVLRGAQILAADLHRLLAAAPQRRSGRAR